VYPTRIIASAIQLGPAIRRSVISRSVFLEEIPVMMEHYIGLMALVRRADVTFLCGMNAKGGEVYVRTEISSSLWTVGTVL
jgi:hypothetical protein